MILMPTGVLMLVASMFDPVLDGVGPGIRHAGKCARRVQAGVLRAIRVDRAILEFLHGDGALAGPESEQGLAQELGPVIVKLI